MRLLATRCLAALVLLLTAPTAARSSATSLPWIDVRGNQLVADGEPIRLRGFNLGNWLLLEDFLFGLYGVDQQMREAMHFALGDRDRVFWDAYESSYFTQADATALRARGANFLRVPLNQLRFEDGNFPGKYSETALAQLDRVIRTCADAGLHVLIDLHAVPGGQSRQIYANSPAARNDFWLDRSARERATRFLVFLAERYKDEPAVAGYDLLNEPETEGRTALLTEWLGVTIDSIRKVDTRHLIWIEGDDYGKRFDGLTPDLMGRERVLVQFHIYPELAMPTDKLSTYPGEAKGVRYDRAFLERYFAPHLEYSKTKPLLLGEFGIFLNGGNVPLKSAVCRDFVSIAEDAGWSWSIWTYKDVGTMSLFAPRPDTPWKQFLAGEHAQMARKKAGELFADHGDENDTLIEKRLTALGKGMPWQESWYPAMGARRAVAGLVSKAIAQSLKSKSDEDLRELGRSFALENCVESEAIHDLFAFGTKSVPKQVSH